LVDEVEVVYVVECVDEVVDDGVDIDEGDWFGGL
jgi:hypothetical protein